MPTVVCKRFAKGPRCSDPRLESTDAEQDDCFTRARIECTGDLSTCLSSLYARNQCHTSTNNEARLPDCIDHIGCIDEGCREAIRRCFCTGLTGLTCTVCPDAPVPPPDEEEEEEGEVNHTIRDASLTYSSFEVPIPIVFGKVVVGGNVIWAGNPRTSVVTTTNTVGNQTDVLTQTTGFVDIAIGLAAGEVEAIGRIWVADVLVVDNRIEFVDEDHSVFNNTMYDLGLNTEFRTGSEAQRLFANMATAEGFGRTPAHRGLSVLMLKNFPVLMAGATFPVIRVEVLSRIDRSVVAFSQLDGEAVEDELLSVDPVSNRAFVGSGDNVKTIDIDSMTAVNEITADDPIDHASVYSTPEGNLLFRAGTTTRHMYGYNHSDVLDRSDIPEGPAVEIVVHDINRERPVSAVITANGRDVSLYKTDFEDQTFEFLTTRSDVTVLGSEFKKIIVCDFNNPRNPGAARMANFFSQSGDNVVITRFWMDNRAQNRWFDPTGEPLLNMTFYGSYLGTAGSSLQFIDAFEDTFNSSIVMQMEDDDGYHHLTNYIVDPLDLSWTVRLPEAPVNAGSTLKFRQNISRAYLFIVPSGNLYRLSLVDGIVTLVANLDDYGAPAITGPQYYDAAKGFIVYVSDGSFVKLYPERYAGADATVADVVMRTAIEAGIDPAYVDVSAVTGITMDGYLIQDQQNAQVVLTGLMDFFHLSGADVGGKLTFRPRSVISTVTLDEDEVAGAVETRVSVDVDKLSSVTVRYFDVDRDGGVFTQIVTRDFMEDFGDFVSNEKSKEYAAEVFTDADAARMSAERMLLRQLQRRDKLELTAAMRALLIEPSDYVNGYRANMVEIDSTLITKVEATTESDDVYDFTPALDGVTVPYENATQKDYDASVRNYLVGFAVPPLQDAPPNEIVYVGQSQPDDVTYVPSPVYTRGPIGAFNAAATPQFEARIGRLVSAPTLTDRRVFSCDEVSEFVVEFIDTVPPEALNNLDDYTDLYSSYTLNAVFIGKEVIQYRTATVALDGKTVTFSGLFRGRFGTDEYMYSHVIGEACALYDPTRVVEGRLGWDASDYGIAIASTFDDRDNTRRRDIEFDFIPQLSRKWTVGHLQMLKKSTGSGRGLYFKVFPRMRFLNTFRDDGNQEVFAANGNIAIAILNGPYDDAQFRAELPNDETYPIDFEQLDVHDNPYIIHLYTNIDEATFLTEGFQYPENSMIEDGVGYTQDLHVAVFNYSNGVLEGDVLGLKYDGIYPYLTFDGGTIYG